MSSRTLVSAVAIALAVAVPVADAHTLSKAAAKQEAARSGAVLARGLGGSPAAVYDCERRTVHAFRCRLGVVALDGAICVSVVRIAYPSHRASSATTRVVRGPDCEPPELIDFL